ncbi:nickel pincer cofactor biosynthesis protein LarC [Desulfovibrio oxamicus]|uniref:Putative nickel insertion protein n=1 Tax=Nitratidesulfovibrio oxamicus TaxID=32016 RepID=A0ABS0J895_9BACT|nr:nickel pincer cofactor biosynthesis protein LarC [Nitratidesulfovibrio oxamicus]MBG3878360.1 nickel pincer cofactor biosynthesis protein LarC [Nitratidesulfovibrio oxamicus]
MKILFYDCFAGMSGDMHLAALLSLGVEPDYLRAELSKLELDHEFELRVTSDMRKGIAGLRVDVALAHEGQDCGQGDGYGHDHGHPHRHDRHEEHDHGHHHARHEHDDHHHGNHHGHHHAHPHEAAHHAGRDHAHAHDHGHDHGHGHEHGHAHAHPHPHGHHHPPHRNLPDIEAIITASTLPEQVQRTSLAIFRRLAEAEARVHGKPVDEVHFHEVGATDSIVDIVGAAICYHRLGVDAAWASPVELGGGFVRCAHGLMPVPAPATAEILSGIPTTRGASPHETTTPTGAAILATLVSRFTAAPRMAVQRTGYGIGHRDTELPNLLRVHLAEVDATHAGLAAGGASATAFPAAFGAASEITSGIASGTAVPLPTEPARLLQCNIDDMTAEQLAVAMDTLMEAGAMDVHFTPIMMKKGRPATCVSLLCAQGEQERFARLLFRHTATLGIKSVPIDKLVLETRFERLETPLGPVTMKLALLDGEVLRAKPELEDCKALARKHGIPLADVYLAIGKART